MGEGDHVRLSGHDVEKGTFSHRYSKLHDRNTGAKYCLLDHIVSNQNEDIFTGSNGSLFEFGVLGLVLGYSMENPNCFVNGKLSLVTLLMVLKSFFISFYASSLMGMMDKNQCIQVIVLKDTSRSALKCETDTFSVFQDE
ncbi:uncharacterized protein [Physcomitrium patens]|uniref:uncharacterized protein n=1 Tax=Physcomitrium patens TaxID=3218 RepID=UPI003CCCCF85